MNLVFIAAGLAGGLVRGLTGYVKYLSSYKGVKFNWIYFLVMTGVSGLAGGIAGWIFGGIMQEGMNEQWKGQSLPLYRTSAPMEGTVLA